MKQAMRFVGGLLLAAHGSAVHIRGTAQHLVEPSGLNTAELESALLTMLDQGNTPALQDFVSKIYDLLRTRMVPAVFEHRNEEQARLDKAEAAFGKCKSDLTAAIQKVKARETSISSACNEAEICVKDLDVAQKASDDCKSKVSVYSRLKDAECSALDQLVKSELARSHCRLTAAAFGSDVTTLLNYYSGVQKRWSGLSKNCSSATALLTSTTAECARKTQALSSLKTKCPQLHNKCTDSKCGAYKSHTAACDGQDKCFATERQTLASKIALAKIQEQGLKGEYEALRRLECLTGVFNKTDTDKSKAISFCRSQDQSEEVKKMSLRYPEPPSRATCTPSTHGCPTCATYKCPATWVKKAGSDALVANDLGTCCRQNTCNVFTCPQGWIPKSSPATRVGQSAGECCDQVAFSLSQLGQEMYCSWWGDPHYSRTFGGWSDFHVHMWNIPGTYWQLNNKYIWIQTKQECSYRGGPCWSVGLAVGGPFLEGNSIVNLYGTTYWNGRQISNGGSWRFQVRDDIAISGSGTHVSIQAPMMVRASGYHHAWDISVRQMPGGMSGQCVNQVSGCCRVDGAKDLFAQGMRLNPDMVRLSLLQQQAVQPMNSSLAQLYTAGKDCPPEKRKAAEAKCKKAFGDVKVSDDRLEGCIQDECWVAGQQDWAGGAASKAEEDRAADALMKPLEYVVIGEADACPANTVPAVPSSKAEAAAVKARLASSPKGKVCQPATRLYRPGGFLQLKHVLEACSTQLGALQLAMPKSLEELRSVQEAVKKAGSNRVWLGGKYVNGEWQWLDGSKVGVFAGLPLPVPTKSSGKFLCLACTVDGATCSLSACGGQAGETHTGICESKIV